MVEIQEDPVNLFMTLDRWPLSPFDDDGEAEAEPEATQSSDTYMIGFVIVNIVGLQYYSGTISGREMVALVREPLNPYDENAIRVFNTRSVQVGHIEKTAARVLAPLIDGNLVVVEGIVPKIPNRGNSNRFKIPCQVQLYHFASFRFKEQSFMISML